MSDKKNVKEYPILRNQSLVKFYYKGESHTHPVRRTVVLIENHPEYFCGYELREGAEVRTLQSAPVKSYNLGRVARISQVDRRRKIVSRARRHGLSPSTSTLWRGDLIDLTKAGV